MRFAISECAVSLAVSALTGNVLVHIIPILVFRALTRQNWFDMVLGIPVETQLGIFCRKKKTSILHFFGSLKARSQT